MPAVIDGAKQNTLSAKVKKIHLMVILPNFLAASSWQHHIRTNENLYIVELEADAILFMLIIGIK